MSSDSKPAVAGKPSAADSRVRTDETGEKLSLMPRLIREVRTHPFGYTVLVLFLIAGPLLAPLLFPQAPPAVAAVGGLAFGIYAALCAVPQKFL